MWDGRAVPAGPGAGGRQRRRVRSPELWLGGAEDTVVILQVRATVAGVFHVQRVIQKVQVLLCLGDMLCRVLLRIQDLQ